MVGYVAGSLSPWNEAPYANAVEKNLLGGLSLDGFLSEWALMAVLDPVLIVENLIYNGYAGDPSSAVRVTRKRRVDSKKQNSDRNVFPCFVFGPKEAGKSSFLHYLIRRPFSEVYMPVTEVQYTVSIVDQPEVEMKEKGYKKKDMKDLVDPEKLQATLADESFSNGSDPEKLFLGVWICVLKAILVFLYTDSVPSFRLDEFMAGFNTISLKLKEMYQVNSQSINRSTKSRLERSRNGAASATPANAVASAQRAPP